jgi:hypothetical protein
MLVTAEGKWVLPDSEEFLAALGDPNPDYDAIGFSVRNLGFVKFQVFDRLVTEIELHPRNVDLRALLALERLLGEAGTKLFRIRYLENEWHSEISASAEHTMARLRELCAPVFNPPATERFHVEPRDPEALFGQAHRTEGLGLMALKWRVAFGSFDSSVIGLASRNDLLPHLAVVSIKSNDAEPVFRFMGDVHANWLEGEHRLNVIGERLENLPDKDYGGWAAQFYTDVARTGRPRYDHISATIHRRPQPYVTHYERLLLPWKTSSSEIVVTAFSKRLSDASTQSSSETASSLLKNSAKSS